MCLDLIKLIHASLHDISLQCTSTMLAMHRMGMGNAKLCCLNHGMFLRQLCETKMALLDIFWYTCFLQAQYANVYIYV